MKNDIVSPTFAYIQGFDLLVTQAKEDHRLYIIKVQPLVVMNQMHRAISMIGRFFTFCYEIASNPIVTEFITVGRYVTILIPNILFFVCTILIHQMPLDFFPSIPLRVSLKLVWRYFLTISKAINIGIFILIIPKVSQFCWEVESTSIFNL